MAVVKDLFCLLSRRNFSFSSKFLLFKSQQKYITVKQRDLTLGCSEKLHDLLYTRLRADKYTRP